MISNTDPKVSGYYKRYAYIVYLENLDNVARFKYSLYEDYQVDKEPKKTFKYRSNALLANTIGDLDILLYGDQPLNKIGDQETEEVVKENYDLVFILGDMGYDMKDRLGLKSDDYFDSLEP